MMPSYPYPYPSISSLQKRSSIASERPYLHKYGLSALSTRQHQHQHQHQHQYEYQQQQQQQQEQQQQLLPPYKDNVNRSSYSPLDTLDTQSGPLLSATTPHDKALSSTGVSASTLATTTTLTASVSASAPPSTSATPLQKYNSTYESRYPLYSCDWTSVPNTGGDNNNNNNNNNDNDGEVDVDIDVDTPSAKVVLSTYREDGPNKLQVINGTPTQNTSGWIFTKQAEHTVKYPVTRVQWDPGMFTHSYNSVRFATTSERLRIYEVNDSGGSDRDGTIVEVAALSNAKTRDVNQMPPITSFDWNRYNRDSLITCSIDTTCTVWDLSKERYVAKTQLIAHDSEVYDVKYIYGDTNVFASCSADGSVRIFDLRNLEQSTIIYESADSNADGSTEKLVRLACSSYNANQVAVLAEDSRAVRILDLRNVGVPLYTLEHHSAPVNAIGWHPTKNMLLTGGDDCQVLVYDFSSLTSDNSSTSCPSPSPLPSWRLGVPLEDGVSGVCWSPDGRWAGVTAGLRFQGAQAESMEQV